MPPSSKKQSSSAPPPPQGYVLVVEDDVFLRGLLVDKLRKSGYPVQEAENGKKALVQLRTTTPILIFLDLLMPEMDGFQFLEEMKKDKKVSEVPVCVLSNLDDPGQIARAQKLGVRDYLIKANLFLDEIVEKAARIINEKKNLPPLKASS